jgi:hypothetical protein
MNLEQIIPMLRMTGDDHARQRGSSRAQLNIVTASKIRGITRAEQGFHGPMYSLPFVYVDTQEFFAVTKTHKEDVFGIR